MLIYYDIYIYIYISINMLYIHVCMDIVNDNNSSITING